MQGGKNRILPKEMDANRFFWDSHWLEIWSNHFCPSMGPNGGSVAMDSGWEDTLAGEGLGESQFRRGDIHCGALYINKYFVAASQGNLQIFEKDGDGDSAVSTNWSGRTSCVSNTASAREKNTVFSESCSDTQHHPREVIVLVPDGGGGPGPPGVLQPPVEPLHQPIRLLGVSSCGDVAGVEQTAPQGRPQGGRELGPLSEVRVAGTPSLDGDPAGEDGSVVVGGVDGGMRAGTVGMQPHSQYCL
jgi:hypothetical protein